MNPIRREIVSTKEAAGPGVAPLKYAQLKNCVVVLI